MVMDIIRDGVFLSYRSTKARRADLITAADLLDTLMDMGDACAGLSANMIGVRKRIIAFLDEEGAAPVYTVMLNPEIVDAEGECECEQSCIVTPGAHYKCKCHRVIRVRYQGVDMKRGVALYSGRTAATVEHLIDHLNGNSVCLCAAPSAASN